MKGYASELATAGKHVDDDEFKDYILNGLDESFNSLVAAINAVPSTSLNDMCSQLLSCEIRDNMLSILDNPLGLLCPWSMPLLSVQNLLWGADRSGKHHLPCHTCMYTP
jgi:hypothetical protein